MNPKLNWIFALLLIAGIFPATGNGQTVKATPSSINGQINLDSSYEAILTFRDAKGLKNKNLTDPISPAGQFSFSFSPPAASFVNVTIIPIARNKQLAINFPLYIQSNSKETILLEYNDSTYLSLLPASKLSAYNKALILYSNFHFHKQKELFFLSITPENAQPFLSQYTDTVESLIARFSVKNQKIVNYLRAWAMNDYIQALTTIEGKFSRNKNEKLPEGIFKINKASIKVLDNPQATLLNETYSSLRKYISMIDTAQDVKNSDALQQVNHRINLFNQTFTNTQLRTIFNLGELQSYIRQAKFPSDAAFEATLRRFKTIAQKIPDTGKRNELIKDFSNLRYTREGAAMPNVVFKDAQGKKVALSGFKGKNVYIDLWASWCIPCIAEIPNLKKLEEEYEGKNIAFVSISLDEDKGAWKNKMKELNLSGIQLETGESGFEKMMNIQGIPHFILYDTNGKLKMYNAPRPGTSAIRQIFDSL